MAARKCPNCLASVPGWKVVVCSNDLICPGCARPLEISALSRNVAVFVGLFAGAFTWRAGIHTTSGSSAFSWILPILYGYLALSVAMPLALVLFADLRLKPIEIPPIVSDATPHANESDLDLSSLG